jgi:hypothetical protein
MIIAQPCWSLELKCASRAEIVASGTIMDRIERL